MTNQHAPFAFMETDVEIRFWAKVDKSDHPRGCWTWTAGTDPKGYGTFRNVKMEKAHRISWEIANGPPPDGIRVLHKCDNPPCVNPVHLFLGTDKDNSDDKIAKGRARYVGHKGGTNAAAKLTEDDVRSIRSKYAEGNVTQAALAKEYGVFQTNISHIVLRRLWGHVLQAT